MRFFDELILKVHVKMSGGTSLLLLRETFCSSLC